MAQRPQPFCTEMPAGEVLYRRRRPPRFRESDPNCIDIALLNNMADSALAATERRFHTLIEEAADGIAVRLTLYTLPDVPRTNSGRNRVDRLYSDIGDLWDSHVDGLIVTGAEPRAPSLADEPYWGSLTRVLDWAEHHTSSTVWSCLAAHAALLHTDGIGRRPMSDKRFGIFECQRVSDHMLTATLPARMRVPHSRWNDVPEAALRESGYRVLTRSADASVDSFVKQMNRSLFVYFQGHPEYEADTLLLEYRRDIKRFLRGERETYPTMPQGYFDEGTVDLLTAMRERARSDRREELIAKFPMTEAAGKMTNTWRPAAVTMYRAWLLYMCAQKARKLRAG